VLGGAALIVLLLWTLLTFKPVPGAPTGAGNNLVASLLVVIFGFLFVTVSSRICGLIGTSANPVPGAKNCLLAGGPAAPLVSSAIFSTEG